MSTIPVALSTKSPLTAESIFSLSNLKVQFDTPKGRFTAASVDRLSISSGERLGLVGESGSGKSVTFLASLGLLAAETATVTGDVRFLEHDLLKMSGKARGRLLGRDIGYVSQDPLTSLNPAFSIGDQLKEALSIHDKSKSRSELYDISCAALEGVGIPATSRSMKQFPHELSGGTRQRVVIAMATINRPKLLIADEPTTALDVTLQAQILDLLDNLCNEIGTALVLISHDLGLVADHTHSVSVMYGGRMVESGAVGSVLVRPGHPYTSGLLESAPAIGKARRRLPTIPGELSWRSSDDPGCGFRDRCGLSGGRTECREVEPALVSRSDDPSHLARCHFSTEVLPTAAIPPSVSNDEVEFERGSVATHQIALVEVEHVSKRFAVRGSRTFGRRPVNQLQALSDVSIAIRAGRTLALVGESGSGKSTLGRVVMGLLEPSSGVVNHQRGPVDMSRRALRLFRRQSQIVFQDPYSSLNPRMRVKQIVSEPSRVSGDRLSEVQVDELLQSVGLPTTFGSRYPHELSGGQRQRVSIARAISTEPALLVLDEPVSALDVSIQAQILNLLRSLQEGNSIAYLFISHDLSVVYHLADDVAVMYLGRIVEQGSRNQLFNQPSHPYTRALLSAIPGAQRQSAYPSVALEGEIPDPTDPPSGCVFRTRCWLATDVCAQERPELTQHPGVVHRVACHHVDG